LEKKFILIIIGIIALGAVIVVPGYMQSENKTTLQNNAPVAQNTYNTSNSTGTPSNTTGTSNPNQTVQSNSSQNVQNSKNTQNKQDTQTTSSSKSKSNIISAAKAKQIALQSAASPEGVIAHYPSLITFNGRLIWRVPLFKNGKTVSLIDVDAHTGACLGGSC
jgi:FtsZ-interacting cell division protein ZipA